ncbi:MAG TPA: glycerol-3-phosphate 1-O-acyltransferase [bacterium]|nr:glycerol-3-phosphate 1-O-acyltransferase [bacterium]
MISLFVVLLLGYLAGSIPTAIIASRIVMKDDIRNHGSRNAGATNVFRVMGWKPALIVVLIDIGKGVLATLVFARIAVDAPVLSPFILQLLAGCAAIAGHIWTVFAQFRGGKGVGTAFGVLVGLAPAASLITLGVWLILVFATRIVSVGSIAAGLVFPLVLLIQKTVLKSPVPDGLLIMGITLGFLIGVTHRANIRRLLRGEEHRFGSSRNKEGA